MFVAFLDVSGHLEAKNKNKNENENDMKNDLPPSPPRPNNENSISFINNDQARP